MKQYSSYFFIIFLINTLLGCVKITHPSEEVIGINKIQDNDESYYTIDTLLIKKYKSKYGNNIELRGSKSKDLYFIKLNNVMYKVSETWYEAAHQSILWENKNFIFLSYGCGTECWGGKVLSMKEKKIFRFNYHLYTDSIRNHIVYPDSLNFNFLIFENFETEERKSVKFDLCEKITHMYHAIDTIHNIDSNSIVVKYRSNNCDVINQKIINMN